MDLSTRPIEWLAISAVVGGGLWAALTFAPSSTSVGGAVRSPFAANPAAAPAAEGSLGEAPAAPAAAAPEGDRLLVVPESRPAAASSQAAATAAPATTAAVAASKARFAPPRLRATAPIVSLDDRAQTSAFMRTAAHAAGGGEGASAPDSVSPGISRALAARGEPAAAAVHYGVVDRAGLMGRGAGPVYNFRGARAARGSVRYGAQAPAAVPAADAASTDDDAQ